MLYQNYVLCCKESCFLRETAHNLQSAFISYEFKRFNSTNSVQKTLFATDGVAKQLFYYNISTS